MTLYEKAYEIAERYHRGQMRKNSKMPYIVHPLAVVEGLENKYKGLMSDEDYEILISLGILHDVIEDCDISMTELREMLSPYGTSYQIPVLMASLAVITKVKGKTTYFLYLTGVKSDKFALLVKIEDVTHNLSNLAPGTLRDKYELALHYLTT